MWEDFYTRGVMGLGWHELGDLREYSTKEDMRLALQQIRGNETSQKNSAHAVWQFAHDIKPGDIVFVKRGRTEILGRGVVVGGYAYDADAGHYPNLREVKWTHKGHWTHDDQFAMKTLTDVTDYTDFVEKVNGYFEEMPRKPSGGRSPQTSLTTASNSSPRHTWTRKLTTRSSVCFVQKRTSSCKALPAWEKLSLQSAWPIR